MYHFSQGSAKSKKQHKKTTSFVIRHELLGNAGAATSSGAISQPEPSTTLGERAPAMNEEAKNQALSDISISKSRGPW